MKIVVLVKEVPDTYGDRVLDLETGLAQRDAGDRVLDEIGERALEVALAHADASGDAEVVLLSMAPEAATTSLRRGLAMGAASAVQVVDEGLVGADLGLTSQVLAAALDRIGFDLAITGNLSTDGTGGVLPAMIAELLDIPAATALTSVRIGDGEVAGVRASDAGTMEVSAALPAVISITEALPDPRMANFKGIMAAKKKPFETLTLADLDIDPLDARWSRSIMIGIAEKPPRAAGVKIVDEGDAGEKLADFLVENRLA
ncbi:MAG: electron transfer flavoprotein subunit beta [Zunongwangia sp.]|uniref:electron transfer flavoprotein subunit beta/FixA family protein n=1 Tax=unclassified Microbacterium TaxID=2609290 RepID=UPI000C471391|nr:MULTISPECIES: electron transfer flavoprotein subunit beta/FixA family protein [unclassified Microbacterium]MAO34820.1 electron transfer flavoprotein subunit beta [Zunongwangia sp.]MAM54302.1 electron transfer flavoprotein subunit beta [Microbacterium sp.]MAY50408.1 electron transfer flavoprotein subunit beta [Microbacterium sp.]HAS31700.1 electron transfer flavoprotein subunit beta [Microbacterium sp.]HBR88965.1 electron transfer flavoprotein subunit beta [Microbacterium sp.]|tara:strand:+ start:358 stop:1134 length:777 start_codon:yes stop_codon:yes gene_type:complete